ncbi:hypothetical protein [Burkholderia sp. ABCPW 14]|uniref:hypothetical protein n=1 Tax=Burkholderia sp. ABCPW 14 TaxID=1637860 RepID=UPI000AD6D926|nr:hypothetical protein [Burkholderia sp. ABCPW 14]
MVDRSIRREGGARAPRVCFVAHVVRLRAVPRCCAARRAWFRSGVAARDACRFDSAMSRMRSTDRFFTRAALRSAATSRDASFVIHTFHCPDPMSIDSVTALSSASHRDAAFTPASMSAIAPDSASVSLGRVHTTLI